MVDPSATANELLQMWRKQLEESATIWARMIGHPPAPPAPDPTAFWRPVFNQGLEQWSRLLAQTPLTPDLVTQWKQFMDQWIETWSKAFGQAMSSEVYAQTMGRVLDQWLMMQAPVKKTTEQAVEQALTTLNLASRSQLTSLAQQVVELEDRLERIEEGIAAVLKRLDAKEPL